MPFIHPIIFWVGLGAVAIPIIIHLLNRRRFRVKPWAAMRFLYESLRQNRRRLRIEELILLALRCLVVFLLAAGIARYTGCSALSALPIGEGGSETLVFILDDSYSMGQKVGSGTLFSAAVTDVSRQLSKLKKTNRIAILLGTRPQEPFFKLDFLTDPDSLLLRVGTLKPSDRRLRLAESLAAARDILKNEPGAKRVCVFSDFRRVDLAAAEQAPAIRKEFSSLRQVGVEVVAADYGREPQNNLTIQSIEMLNRFAVAKTPLRVGVTVRNNGPRRVQNVQIRLIAKMKVDGTTGEAALPVVAIASLDPQESKQAEATVTLPQAGPAVITAELPADELAADNRASLALDVRAALKILVIDGQPDLSDPVESESFFLVMALDPSRDGSYGVKPEVVASEAAGNVNFDEYDMVVMMNVAELSQDAGSGVGGREHPMVGALEKYVRGGGGLVIFTGDRLNTQFYRKYMYAEGLGLCPMAILPRQGDPSKKDQFFRLDPKSISSESLLKCFRGEAAAMTGFVRFFAINPVQETAAPAVADAKPPRVLARFNDPRHSPALVIREFGKGSVLLVCTTGSLRWSDWPIDEMGTFVSVMHDTVAYLARGQEERFTGRVGEPIFFSMPANLADAKATLRTPRYPEADLIPVKPAENEKNMLRYERASDAGVYTLAFGDPANPAAEYHFARNMDGVEGDLAPGGKTDITSAFGSGEFRYERRVGGASEDAANEASGKEYWLWALAAALYLMAAEVYFAQRFGHYAK